MSLFVLLLQIHRVRRKGQVDLSNTKIRTKFIGPQTVKRSTCAKLDFFPICVFYSIQRRGLGGGCLIYRSSGSPWSKCCQSVKTADSDRLCLSLKINSN